MRRKPDIKWRKSDAEKLTKEIERFNAKVNRLAKNKPEINDVLPEKIYRADKKELIEQFKGQPRSEFNKYINSLGRFLKKNAEKVVSNDYGLKATQWEKKEVGYKVNAINRERAKEKERIERIEVTSQGKPTGMKRGEMGSERMNSFAPKKYNFNKIKPGKEWKKYKESVSKQSNIDYLSEKMERYKDNYLKGLENFGGYEKQIADIIKQLPADVVVETYFKEQEAEIKFYYEAIKGIRDKDEVLDTILGIWQTALDDYNEEIRG